MDRTEICISLADTMSEPIMSSSEPPKAKLRRAPQAGEEEEHRDHVREDGEDRQQLHQPDQVKPVAQVAHLEQQRRIGSLR